MKKKFILIKTTYPNLREAKKLAKILLEKKLSACVNFNKIESLYQWQKKIENSKEILVSIKTKNSLFKKIEKIILLNHQYQLPQIIAIPIEIGSKKYLEWLDLNCS
jgi:periplasmic divalent cation tolerance protein